MTFPVTSVLDDFNRANANPLDGSWTLGFWGDRDPKILSNVVMSAASAGQFCGAQYNAATYGPNCEVYLTCTTVVSSADHDWYIHARVGGAVANPNSYCLNIIPVGDFAVIERLDSGSETQLGASFTIDLVSGDKIGLSVVGSSITAYHYTSGAWVTKETRSDSTYSGAGYLAFEMRNDDAALDNFGGGTISAASGVFARRTNNQRTGTRG